MQKNLFDFATHNQDENDNKKRENLYQNKGDFVNPHNNFNFAQTEKEMSSQNSQINENQHYKESATKNKNISLEEQARAAYEKYQNYSQDELMKEFLKTSKQKLKDGSLTTDKLTNTVNSLSPFLNDNQKEFLKGLLDKLND